MFRNIFIFLETASFFFGLQFSSLFFLFSFTFCHYSLLLCHSLIFLHTLPLFHSHFLSWLSGGRQGWMAEEIEYSLSLVCSCSETCVCICFFCAYTCIGTSTETQYTHTHTLWHSNCDILSCLHICLSSSIAVVQATGKVWSWPPHLPRCLVPTPLCPSLDTSVRIITPLVLNVSDLYLWPEGRRL